MTSDDTLTIPGYKIGSRLGEGKMGVVYKATQINLDRPVAIKIIHPALSSKPEVAENFRKEARTVALLNHPYIVLGIDTGVIGKHHYFVMEFLEGGSLLDLIKRNGRISQPSAVDYLMHAAKALKHASEFDLIHRDIKPDNMMIDAYGKLKITDLGLAQITTGEEEDESQGVIGTPHYISPEQLRRLTPLDSRCDIYSLGATMFHLVTGKPPFSGSNAKEIALARLKEPVPEPGSFEPELTAPFCKLIKDMMTVDRDERISSPTELIERISDLNKPKLAKKKGISGIFSSLKQKLSGTPTLLPEQVSRR